MSARRFIKLALATAAASALATAGLVAGANADGSYYPVTLTLTASPTTVTNHQAISVTVTGCTGTGVEVWYGAAFPDGSLAPRNDLVVLTPNASGGYSGLAEPNPAGWGNSPVYLEAYCQKGAATIGVSPIVSVKMEDPDVTPRVGDPERPAGVSKLSVSPGEYRNATTLTVSGPSAPCTAIGSSGMLVLVVEERGDGAYKPELTYGGAPFPWPTGETWSVELDLTGNDWVFEKDAIDIMAFCSSYSEIAPIDYITVYRVIDDTSYPLPPSQSTPAMTVGSKTVPQGGALKVNLTGFAAGEQVEIGVRSDYVKLATWTVGQDGAYSGTVTLPSSIALGAHTLQATQVSTGQVAAEAAITVVAPGDVAKAMTDVPQATSATWGAWQGWLSLAGLVLTAGLWLARRRRAAAPASADLR
ncbi:MAG: hypothetical protein LBR19_04955 [Bifidobacteriaceae bacterium]|jgi:hypothetical protein|nr:hypothetical protein [Bifidobacteriaceae bacterium]